MRVKNNIFIIFIFTFTCVIIFRIWLISGIPKWITYSPHDGLYYARLANYIIHGQWFGPYSKMTLIKAPFYSFFMIFSFLTGLPLLLNETLLYLGSCFVLYVSLSPLIKNKWWRLILFIVMLYCPATLANGRTLAVYREFVYFSLTLYLVAFAIGMFLRLDKKISSSIIWGAGLGLSIGFFLITREEGVWIYPALFFYFLVVVINIIVKGNLKFKKNRILIVLMVILIAYTPTGLISLANYHYYGFFGISENLDTDFNRVINTLGSIKTDKWYPYSPVTKESLTIAYSSSPLFRELKPSIEKYNDAWLVLSINNVKSKPDWYQEKYLKGYETYEIGSLFVWSLRDVLSDQGYYSNGKFPRDFLQELADQLEDACNNNIVCLSKTTNLPRLSYIRKEHLPIILDFFIDDFINLINYDKAFTKIASLDVKNRNPQTYKPEFRYFKQFIYNPIDYYTGDNLHTDYEQNFIINGKTDIRLVILRYKESIMKSIYSLYKYFTIPMMILFVFLWLLSLIVNIFKKSLKSHKYNIQAIFIFLFTMSLLLTRMVTLSIAEGTSSLPANYAASNYIFFYIVLFIMGYYLRIVIIDNINTFKNKISNLYN